MAAHRLRGVLCLGVAGAELDGGVAIRFGQALGDDLQVLHLQDGDRDLPAVLHEEPGHPELLGYDTRAHHALLRA